MYFSEPQKFACEASNVSEKKRILLQKIAFWAFFVNCKMKMEFLSNFSPIVLCSNLFSKLFDIGEKWL